MAEAPPPRAGAAARRPSDAQHGAPLTAVAPAPSAAAPAADRHPSPPRAAAEHLELSARLLQLRAGDLLEAQELCRKLECSAAGLSEHVGPGWKECSTGSTKDPAEDGLRGRRDLKESLTSESFNSRARFSTEFVLPVHPERALSVSSASAEDAEEFMSQLEQLDVLDEVITPSIPRRSPSEWVEETGMLRELKREYSEGGTLRDLELEKMKHDSAPAAFRVLHRVVGSPRFVAFWAVVVGLNIVAMMMEEEHLGMKNGAQIGFYTRYGTDEYMNQWWPSIGQIMFTADCVFLALFSIEIALVYTYDLCRAALGLTCNVRKPFWRAPWDILDLVVVVVSMLTLIMKNGPLEMAKFMRVLRLIRITRLVRFIRVFSCLDPLHLMITAINRGIGAFFFSAILLVMILSAFAMVLSQYFRLTYLGEHSHLKEDVKAQLFRYFGTYSRSMLSMFELTLANWPHIARFLVEEVHEGFTAFCLLFKLSVGFAVIGVINGVFIQETFASAQEDELIMVRKRMRDVQRLDHRLARLFKMADINTDGLLTRDELGDLLQKRPIRTWLEAMQIPCTDVNILFDLVGGGKKEVPVDEFIVGITRLKGNVRNIDMLNVLTMVRELKASRSCQKAD